MSPDVQKEAAQLLVDGKSIPLDIITGSEGERALDISALRSKTGLVALDPGFGNTGSCQSSITFLDGEVGIIRHRGYPLEQLAEKATYVELSYLLLTGELPTTEEFYVFKGMVQANNYIGERLKELMNHYPIGAHPMSVLSSVVLSLTGFYPDLGIDLVHRIDMDIVRLLAKTPCIAAYNYRRTHGKKFIQPTNEFDYTENFLNMMFGDEIDAERRQLFARVLRQLLIIHADHEQNCSTSTVRMVSSSNANVYAAISGGIGALWGPLHGGANEAVINMLDSILEGGEDISHVVARAKDKSDPFRLMGFGHRVYKVYDPRARIAKACLDEMLDALDINEPLVDIAMQLEKVALEDEYFVSRNLYPNVDFYTGLIYRLMGIPKNMFTVMFAMGRMAGWLAHLVEFRQDSQRRIGRPRQIFTGAVERDYVSMDQRTKA